MPRPIHAIIHTAALQHNLARMRQAAPDARLWAVVKANAYGHGIERVFDAMRATDGFALLELSEAERIRQLGWRGPILPFFRPIWPVMWFLGKMGFMVFMFIWVRATLPRYRYDKLMRFGWKVLIPASLAWVMITGVVVVLPQHVSRVTLAASAGLAFSLLFLIFVLSATYRRFGTLSPLKLMPFGRRA